MAKPSAIESNMKLANKPEMYLEWSRVSYVIRDLVPDGYSCDPQRKKNLALVTPGVDLFSPLKHAQKAQFDCYTYAAICITDEMYYLQAGEAEPFSAELHE